MEELGSRPPKRRPLSFGVILKLLSLIGLFILSFAAVSYLRQEKYPPFSTGTPSKAFSKTTWGMSVKEVERALGVTLIPIDLQKKAMEVWKDQDEAAKYLTAESDLMHLISKKSLLNELKVMTDTGDTISRHFHDTSGSVFFLFFRDQLMRYFLTYDDYNSEGKNHVEDWIIKPLTETHGDPQEVDTTQLTGEPLRETALLWTGNKEFLSLAVDKKWDSFRTSNVNVSAFPRRVELSSTYRPLFDDYMKAVMKEHKGKQ